MKIEIQRIVRPLRLADYAPEYGEVCIQVWVNPTKRLNDQWNTLAETSAALRGEISTAIAEKAGAEKLSEPLAQLEAMSEQVLAWLSEVWSQGVDESHFSVEDVRQLVTDCQENDMAFYEWLVGRTRAMIRDYRIEKKKA